MNTVSVKKGFTLLELIISFGIMSIVIFGAASLYVSSIRGNASQIQRFIAYSLAQEGLEGVRNIRDSYFRQGLAWNGSSTEATLVEAAFLPGTYRIARKTSISTSALDPKDAVLAASPWVFQACPKDQACDDLLYQMDSADVRYYVHAQNAVISNMNPSPYRRTVSISFLTPSGGVSDVPTDRMLVTTHVEWSDHGAVKSVDLSTELSNWKQRPF